MIGKPDSQLVQGAHRSARLHGLRFQMLTAGEVHERFPALRPERDMIAVWEPRAGVLFPETCISTYLTRARQYGAELRYEESVLRWESDGDRVRVMTAQSEYHARRLVLTAGAWVGLLAELPVQIERQTLFWFDNKTASERFAPPQCPVHLWQFDGLRFFYGFPDFGGGVKVAFHHGGEITTVDAIRRGVSLEEIEDIRAVVKRFVPAANGPLRTSAVCMYANTPDEHFLIDRHPLHRPVLIASACSGHGFKFAPVVAEILADLAQGKQPAFDLSLFRWR
jgi:sarcosine oxidase